MMYKVTQIEFDFSGDYDDQESLTEEYKGDLICDVMSQEWVADDDDDLIEEITCYAGWCIKSLEYECV